MKRFLSSESFELEIKKSVFIAQNFEVFSRDDAIKIVKSLKAENPGAAHVCWAFVIGKDGELLGMSDDGEPSGTAGKPILSVLKGSGATNVLITVIRFFGGIKLGTGGLVKAYQGVTKELLACLDSEEIVTMREFSFSCSYSHFNTLKNIFAGVEDLDYSSVFQSEVFVEGVLPLAEWDKFRQSVLDATSGDVRLI